MRFPTVDEVNAANTLQLAKWWRFLECTEEHHIDIINLVADRFKEAGGWTPALSKQVGWD